MSNGLAIYYACIFLPFVVIPRSSHLSALCASKIEFRTTFREGRRSETEFLESESRLNTRIFMQNLSFIPDELFIFFKGWNGLGILSLYLAKVARCILIRGKLFSPSWKIIFPGEGNGQARKSFHSNTFEPIRTHSEPFEHIRTHSNIFGPIRTHSDPFRAIRTHLDPFEPIQTHSNPFGPIRTHSNTFGPFQTHSDPFKHIRTH